MNPLGGFCPLAFGAAFLRAAFFGAAPKLKPVCAGDTFRALLMSFSSPDFEAQS